MRKWWAIASCVAGAAGLAGGAKAASSGDKCTYTGSGTTYTVNIVAGSGVQHFGFAFRVPGLTLTNVGVSGQNGQFTKSNLPPGTSGAWVSDATLAGNVVATLTGNGRATGPIVIVPSAAPQSSYFDPVTCSAGTAPAKTVSFTVASHAAYSAAARGWHLAVKIPVAGTVSAKQPLAKSYTVRPKPLVQAKREALKTPGTVTLLLKATPQGQAALAAKGALKVKITVALDTQDGREAHKTVALTLRK
jgi:hypothetical protein